MPYTCQHAGTCGGETKSNAVSPCNHHPQQSLGVTPCVCVVKVILCKRDLFFCVPSTSISTKMQVLSMEQDLMHCHCIRFRTHKFNQKSSTQSIRAGRVFSAHGRTTNGVIGNKYLLGIYGFVCISTAEERIFHTQSMKVIFVIYQKQTRVNASILLKFQFHFWQRASEMALFSSQNIVTVKLQFIYLLFQIRIRMS